MKTGKKGGKEEDYTEWQTWYDLKNLSSKII